MMKTAPVEQSPPRPVPTPIAPRVLRGAIRVAATLTAADAVLQALLAGRFLAGNFDSLALHGTNAIALGVLTVVLLGMTVARSRVEHGPWWPVAAAGALLAAEGLQIWVAQQNLLELHVPLGVGVIAALIMITTWAWRDPHAGRESLRHNPEAQPAVEPR
ncbi:hypothetical protein ACFXO9_25635 [Nocardia tengchongensis]|uniref:hypothetical protein n=1 Tax=Nocardia tengchongensis TaxID=2055889 RepID=UPI0036887DBF